MRILKLLFVLLSLLFVTPIFSQNSYPEGITHSGRRTKQEEFPIYSYTELENPTQTNSKDWQGVSGVNVSWGTIDERYRKEIPPIIQETKNVEKLVGWRGERVASQLVIWSDVHLESLSIEVSDLINKDYSNVINSSDILTGFVRNVMSDELNKGGKGGCGARPNSSEYDSLLVADPIDHLTTEIGLKRNSAQGVWIRVWIPQEISPGLYSGTVVVKNNQEVIEELTLQVDVKSHVLPSPSDWNFFLDLWQNPFAIARYYRVEPWSKEHFEIMRPYMEMYRDAGGKAITASIMHKPWNGQTYDYFETMVTWIKKADGRWEFDYTIFDLWVDFMINLGIKDAITCYSMVPWDLSFQYFDQANNKLDIIKMKPGDQKYEEVWGAMLLSFEKHLKEKGWFEITYIAMDERPMEIMKETIQVIREVTPDFKISLAGALHDELSDDLDYYCVALRMKYDDDVKVKRADENKITTFYTSCEEPLPNVFTFSMPAESEWFGWYAAKANLDGYLRWAYNSWVIEPLLDSRFYTWAAGDTYFVYPGARTSIRFERLINGIQSYEKIQILKELYQETADIEGMEKINNALELFDEESLKEKPAREVVKMANDIVNNL